MADFPLKHWKFGCSGNPFLGAAVVPFRGLQGRVFLPRDAAVAGDHRNACRSPIDHG